MEILVLHPGALGDIILSLPALGVLRRQFPQARITLSGNLDFLDAVSSGHADRLLSLSALPLHNLFGSGPLPASDQQFWRSFDRIVSWTGSASEQFIARLTAVHSRVLVAPWKPVPNEKRHVSRIFVDSLRPWVGEQEDIPAAKIAVSPADRDSGEAWLAEKGWDRSRRIIALHPGAGSAAKRWPLANFQELATRILQFTESGLLAIAGPAEPGLGQELATALLASRVIVAEALPLRRLAAALARCTAFVGNDTGVGHMAAALDVPCLVLYGPSCPEQWAPAGGNLMVLRASVGCPACERGKQTGHTCLASVSVETVWSSLQSLYGK